MANTFSQIYIHIIFAVKGRQHLINVHWENELYKYITGVVKNKGQKLIAINGMPDHIHILIGMKPDCRLAELVREIKKSSSNFVREKHLSKFKFQWQEGYAAFSYAQSNLERVIMYISNQKEHHKNRSFESEYKDFLLKFQIEHKENFMLD
ncbi:IS200/IS605 family transposase [Sphingobacterium oryzagri]|uniref:IS200/IS605 family transposase n=1 Tax=Sphingobacterium oryzagri TaxID=3025669 RepID=A0ABY7WL86_9SPHI|nr:IS200/IS605 family transposase [Sphingobacterium sp. KACC 22765]WDF68114.1 IS200/IS605 family transposase [Sphingobacterium sp. KACC 22765]